jgi:2-polyprenyl-6-hydroxyphenyl methylase/3-demethylubiquinone-9 3-methyltransferase
VEALALYRDLPLGVRLHTRIRARSCPFEAVVARVPARGRLLEVGCGHGLFANEAALHNDALSVLGIDPSVEKIRWAECTTRGRTNVRFRCARVESILEEGFDSLAVVDVLYLVPRREWLAFLGSCRKRLRPGGQLLLKEVDVRPRWKFYRCVAQETVAVRWLGVTLGSTFSFAPPEVMSALLREAGFEAITVTDLGAGYATPHVLYEAVRA